MQGHLLYLSVKLQFLPFLDLHKCSKLYTVIEALNVKMFTA